MRSSFFELDFHARRSHLTVPASQGVVPGLGTSGLGLIGLDNFWKTLISTIPAGCPCFLDGWWWPLGQGTDVPPLKEGTPQLFLRLPQFHPALLHQPTQQVRQRRVCRFFGAESRAQGAWTLKWHRDFNIAGPWTRAGHVQPQRCPNGCGVEGLLTAIRVSRPAIVIQLQVDLAR